MTLNPFKYLERKIDEAVSTAFAVYIHAAVNARATTNQDKELIKDLTAQVSKFEEEARSRERMKLAEIIDTKTKENRERFPMGATVFIEALDIRCLVYGVDATAIYLHYINPVTSVVQVLSYSPESLKNARVKK